MRAAAMMATIVLFAAPVLAHVTVSPQQSAAGAVQVYKVRVHNDGRAPTSSIELSVPQGVEVRSVEPAAGAKSEMGRTGNRIATITWHVEVPVGKYVELAFDATNPPAGTRLVWSITETFADGSTIEYSDKPGAKARPSITTLTGAPK